MAGQFNWNVFELAGVGIEKDNPPWWVQGILRWLYCVKSLQEASGDYTAYRIKCKDYLDNKPPVEMYKLFDDYVNRIESDEFRANAKRR